MAALIGLVACGGDAPTKKEMKEEEPTAEAKILSVELSTSEFTLVAGESQWLEATVRGEGDFDPEVIWATSDYMVATVLSGRVVAVSEGEVTITATSRADATKSASATLTVSAAPMHGELRITISGLPEGMDAGVELLGPDDFVAMVPESKVFEDLLPGPYIIFAFDLSDDIHHYTPVKDEIRVAVQAGKTSEGMVTFVAEERPLIELRTEGPRTLPLHARVDVQVELIRRGDFEEPVTIRAEGLPEGVTAEEVTIPADEELGVLQLVSDGTIRKLGLYEFELVGKADAAEHRSKAGVRIDAIVTEFEDSGPGTLRYYVDILPELENKAVFRSAMEGGVHPPVVIRFEHPEDEPVSIALESPLIVEGPAIITGWPQREDGVPLVELHGNGQSQLMVVDGGFVGLDFLTFRGGIATDGGAILNRGRLRIHDSRFEANTATQAGGAIKNEGDLHLEDVSFLENVAEVGGAVLSSDGELTAYDTLFRGNASETDGGAMVVQGGEASIQGCTFHLNQATGKGGGIAATAKVEVSNSTLANNVADEGGAFSVSGPAGFLVLHHATVSGNTGAVGGAIFNDGFVRLKHSILAGNTASSGPDVFAGPEAIDTLSLSRNLFGTLDGSGIAASETDLEVEDPGLEELGDNGGPTPTMALLPGSPAIDVIPAALCVDVRGVPLNADQTGRNRRPKGEGCDIGAYEYR